jgi:hypothetical protein
MMSVDGSYVGNVCDGRCLVICVILSSVRCLIPLACGDMGRPVLRKLHWGRSIVDKARLFVPRFHVDDSLLLGSSNRLCR